MNKSKNHGKFLQLFHSHKIILLAHLGPFTDRSGKFPNPFIYLN